MAVPEGLPNGNGPENEPISPPKPEAGGEQQSSSKRKALQAETSDQNQKTKSTSPEITPRPTKQSKEKKPHEEELKKGLLEKLLQLFNIKLPASKTGMAIGDFQEALTSKFEAKGIKPGTKTYAEAFIDAGRKIRSLERNSEISQQEANSINHALAREAYETFLTLRESGGVSVSEIDDLEAQLGLIEKPLAGASQPPTDRLKQPTPVDFATDYIPTNLAGNSDLIVLADKLRNIPATDLSPGRVVLLYQELKNIIDQLPTKFNPSTQSKEYYENTKAAFDFLASLKLLTETQAVRYLHLSPNHKLASYDKELIHNLIPELTRMVDQIEAGIQGRQSPYGLSEFEQRIIINGQGRLDGEQMTRAELFARFFGVANVLPGMDFRSTLSYEDTVRINSFIATLRFATKDSFAIEGLSNSNYKMLMEYYATEYQIRELFHNANYLTRANGKPEDLAKYLNPFRGEFLDFILNKKREQFVGVSDVIKMFETSMQEILHQNAGSSPMYTEMVTDYDEGRESILEHRVRKKLDQHLKMRLIHDADGRPVLELPDWQKEQIIGFARGFHIVTLRFVEIVAENRLPAGRLRLLGSLYGHEIARILDPLEQFIEKYQVAKKGPAAILSYDIKQKHDSFFGFFPTWNPNKLLADLDKVAPGDSQRIMDLLNFMRIGGPFMSAWRAHNISEHIPDHLRGVGLRLGLLSHDVWNEMEKSHQKNEQQQKMSDNEWHNEWERLKKDKGLEHIHDERVAQRKRDIWRDASRYLPRRVAWTDTDPNFRLETIAKTLGLWQEVKNNRNLWQGNDQLRQHEVEEFLRQQSIINSSLGGIEDNNLLQQLENDLEIVQEKLIQGWDHTGNRKNDQYKDIFDLLAKEPNFLDGDKARCQRVLEFALRVRTRFDINTIDKKLQKLNPILIGADISQSFLEQVREEIKQDQNAARNKYGNNPFFQEIANMDDEAAKKCLEDATKHLIDFAKQERSSILGFEDMPFDQFRFIEAGGSGFIARRMNDFMHAAQAVVELVNLLNDLPTYHDERQILGQLYKIKSGVEGYDSTHAEKVMKQLITGISKYYARGGWSAAPEPIGFVVRLFGRSSAAQRRQGPEAFNWDETGTRNFLTAAWNMHLLDKKGFQELSRDLHADKRALFEKYFRIFGPLAFVILLPLFFEEYQKYNQKAEASVR
ncbi:MAG: hypothetical protein Q8R11_02885 [bacterium]|nr:hypothetical protein [bacterium]